MAYTTPLVTDLGEGDYLVTFTGTSLAAATEVAIAGLPARGRIMRVKTKKTAGTSTTTAPILGNVTDPAATPNATEWAADTTTPADTYDEQPVTNYYAANNALYYRAVWNTGDADNAESVEIRVRAGWAD